MTDDDVAERVDSGGVYVVALVGESPGVVTELLWHLAVRDGCPILGVELWTTRGGWGPDTRGGLETVGPGFFARLRDVVPTLPAWPRDLRPLEDQGAPPSASQVSVFVADIGDVRSAEDARRFSVALHRRLEHLASPSGRPRLVGALSGGRKTMTAAMHSAFSLHASRGDRLCHVLVDRAVEEHLGRERLKQYAFPTERLAGVDLQDQLAVVDIPFFPVGDYLGAGEERPAKLLVATARRELAGLRAETSGVVRFERRGAQAVLAVGAGAQMAPKTALAYAVLVHEGPMNTTALAERANDWMAERSGTPRPVSTFIAPDAFVRTFRTARKRIAAAAEDRSDLATLVPRPHGRRWAVRPDPSLDVTALEPCRVLDVLFPRESRRTA